MTQKSHRCYLTFFCSALSFCLSLKNKCVLCKYLNKNLMCVCVCSGRSLRECLSRALRRRSAAWTAKAVWAETRSVRWVTHWNASPVRAQWTLHEGYLTLQPESFQTCVQMQRSPRWCKVRPVSVSAKTQEYLYFLYIDVTLWEKKLDTQFNLVVLDIRYCPQVLSHPFVGSTTIVTTKTRNLLKTWHISARCAVCP